MSVSSGGTQIGLTHGGALYLDETGAIVYEGNQEAGVTFIAASFTDYLSGFYPPVD